MSNCQVPNVPNFKVQSHQNCQKWHFWTVWIHQNVISRKIWVTVKWSNFISQALTSHFESFWSIVKSQWADSVHNVMEKLLGAWAASWPIWPKFWRDGSSSVEMWCQNSFLNAEVDLIIYVQCSKPKESFKKIKFSLFEGPKVKFMWILLFQNSQKSICSQFW